MIKYLDMENASLEIKLSSFQEYCDFLKNNIFSINELNIKRITMTIEESDLAKFINMINSLSVEKLPIIILKMKLNKLPIIEIPNNIIIFNINSTKVITSDNIYQVMFLDSGNIDLIGNLIYDDANIIVNPNINVKEITFCINNLIELFDKVKDKEINLDGYLVPSFLMREHPCNAYLCNGWKCHKKISTLPKVLTITENYNVYPHGLIDSKLYIGNIKHDNIENILLAYINNDNHKKFVNYCKNVFIKYLANYPYEFMPIIEYVKMEIMDDE